MFAAVLHTCGQPPTYAEHPEPAPAPGRSVVRVTAAPVVPLDLLCASGTSYFGVPATPYVPGVQGVGVVERSARFAAGDRVWFATSAGMAPGDGGLAEYCSVADEDLVPITSEVSDVSAAAIGLSGVAAWMALSWRGRLQAGDNVLVLGGGGAVGQAGIGVARALGASRVVAVARSVAAQQRARSAGADEVIALGGGLDELAADLRGVAGEGFDVVLDPVFGSAATAGSRVLANGGRLVNLGGASGDEAAFSSAILRSRSAEVLGYTNNSLSTEQRRSALDGVFAEVAKGRVAVQFETQPLAEIASVWTRLSNGEAALRQVLTC